MSGFDIVQWALMAVSRINRSLWAFIYFIFFKKFTLKHFWSIKIFFFIYFKNQSSCRVYWGHESVLASWVVNHERPFYSHSYWLSIVFSPETFFPCWQKSQISHVCVRVISLEYHSSFYLSFPHTAVTAYRYCLSLIKIKKMYSLPFP